MTALCFERTIILFSVDMTLPPSPSSLGSKQKCSAYITETIRTLSDHFKHINIHVRRSCNISYNVDQWIMSMVNCVTVDTEVL